jgi:predicted transcriptional regulator
MNMAKNEEEISLEQFYTPPEEASDDELAEAMELLAKKKLRQEKIKRGLVKAPTGLKWSEMSEEQKAKVRAYNYKRTIRRDLYVQKAIDAGIVVTDEEVEAEIARRGK